MSELASTSPPSQSPTRRTTSGQARREATARPTETFRRLARVARQHPLLETRPSLHALEDAGGEAPNAVFVGIGVASGQAVARCIPFDLLGLILAAEETRRATNAERLVVLVADAHAIAHGAPRGAALVHAGRVSELIGRIARRCGLGALQVTRGSELERIPAYRRVLHDIEQRAPEGTDPYVIREVADIAYLDTQLDGILKVGWTLQPSPRGVHCDERTFDSAYRRWVGGEATMLYGKPGRALDDRHPKLPPYLESDPERRVCLEAGEDVGEKLSQAMHRASPSTIAAVRRQLRAITRTYGKLVRPIRGTLEQRVQQVIDDLLDTEPAVAARPDCALWSGP